MQRFMHQCALQTHRFSQQKTTKKKTNNIIICFLVVVFVVICYIHLHIHYMSRIAFLILSFLDFVAFVVRTLIFP